MSITGAATLRARPSVDTTNIEAHDAGHPLGHQHVVGVDEVGNVGGRAAGAEAQVVGGHVGHHRRVAGVKAQARAQHAAPRRFEHRVVYGWVFQHKLGAHAARAVAFLQLNPLNINAVGSGKAYFVADAGHQMRNEARGRRLAVGARNGDNRDAGRGAGWKQHVNHRGGHVARQALGGRDVHAKAGGRIDLNHRAPRLVQRNGNVGG
uniref:Uncharacterized protein n=1 Tax=Tanacetum cinerariifolium TaxID=118510 RepID=A0A699R6Q7_TANCI|nr:hypothetical protein [Tanacetum cinerariifolium]